ncbi:MAG: outer membrane lipoprotein carrier protein LolA [Bacteroidales bacterium]|nr:outer membrane lipoprotein carrier protein LolA [Bacteroidales bacterium]
MKFYTLIITLLISSLTYSQDDTKAKSILDAMAKKFQAYKGMVIEFSLTMENAQEEIKETAKGKAWVSGKQYKIDLMGVETYFDGTTQWSYMKDAEEVNVTTPDPKDNNSFDPSKLFSTYTEGYKIRYIQEVFENTRALHIIDLLPIDVKGSEFNRIRIKVDKDKNIIYQMIRFGKDGNDYTITITKITEDSSLVPAMFKYDPKQHPGVEIIDLRD